MTVPKLSACNDLGELFDLELGFDGSTLLRGFSIDGGGMKVSLLQPFLR